MARLSDMIFEAFALPLKRRLITRGDLPLRRPQEFALPNG